jgi:hypothetical protein
MAVFGGCWLLLEPTTLVFPHFLGRSWGLLAGLVVVSASGALLLSRPRRHLEFRLPPSDLGISIEVGDVLGQQGNVVLGANDTFDTNLSGDIIHAASVQGQLLQRVFDGDLQDLDDQITTSLAGVVPVPDLTKTFGKTDRDPIGTVAVVRKGRTRYFLPAIASMSATKPPRTNATVDELQTALTRAWEAVGRGGQREPVHAPIMGSHLARVGLTRTLLIQVMVISFIAVTKRDSGSSSLTIWVAERDAIELDFAALESWLRDLCAA